MLAFQMAGEEARDVDSPLSSRRCSPDPDCRRPPSACTWSCPCAWRTWWGSPRSTPSPAESRPLYAGGPPAECRAELEAPELCVRALDSFVMHQVWLYELTLQSVTMQGTFSTSTLMQSYGSSDSSISFPPSSSANICTLGILTRKVLPLVLIFPNITFLRSKPNTLLTLC